MECTLDKKLQGFQLIAQEKLQAIICSIPGKKDLIIEASLIKPLEHICAASWLKLKGIQRIFKLDETHAISRSTHDQVQLFMLRSNLVTFKRVLGQIKVILEAQKSLGEDTSFKYFHMICVPACFAYFQQLLEQAGLWGLVGLHRFNWDFIHLDEFVLSMELPNVFSTAFMRADTSLLPAIAHTLRVLLMFCGHPELILSYGEHAGNIVKMLERLGPLPNKPAAENQPDFGALLIIDRDKDYASPLLTPAIYAGLLLEVFSYRAGILEIGTETNKIMSQKLSIFVTPQNTQPSSKASSVAGTGTKVPILRMNAENDEIYSENRYKHFSAASSQIRDQAKTIGLELQKLNAMKLEEMHDYVARKLPKINELKQKLLRHLNASEKLIEMLGGNYRRVQTLEENILNNVSRKRILSEIDELLTTDAQQYNSLRLLCLLHVCSGVTQEELSQFVRNYCNYFGLEQLHIFQQLAKAGLLPALTEDAISLNKTATKLLSNIPLSLPKFQQTVFQANANRLRLLVSTCDTEESDSTNSNSGPGENSSTTSSTATSCPSYVFNRLYIPLIAQLCSLLLKAGSAEDFASKVGMVEHVQLNGFSVKSYAQATKAGELSDRLPLHRRNLFVYVVGGVTYAEIAACNLVARLSEAQICVASDCVLSGADLIAGAF